MKINHLLLILFIFLFTGCHSFTKNPSPTQAPYTPLQNETLPQATQTSSEECGQVFANTASTFDIMEANRRLGRTVNLGEALEFSNEGNLVLFLNQEIYQIIKSAGFTAVRVPINFAAHSLSKSPYTVQPIFFEHVDKIVNFAIKCNLVVIINMHNFGAEGDVPPEQTDRFIAIWKQVAEHYRDYPDNQIYFELTNEPGEYLGPGSWNDLLAKTTKVIRQSNPTRPIIITPSQFGSPSGLVGLRLPKDENFILTFHYYAPMMFTHQGADWLKGSKIWLGTTWDGTNKDLSTIEQDFTKVADWAEEHSIPVFLGEFGSLSYADQASRVRWTTAVRQAAESHGFSWGYWDLCILKEPTFGIVNCNKYVFEVNPGNIDMLHALIPK